MNSTPIGAALLTTLSYFFQLEADYLQQNDQRTFDEELKFGLENAEYDFIIVGGGTAGCLLAYRLSQHFHVLLLEAGGPAPSLTTVPAFRDPSATINGINYFYETIKQRHVSNKRIKLTAGKMLGGSFAHNELIYYRGNSRDFDGWANLTQDSGWKFENVLPIYKRLENYTGPFPSDQRGTNGPIPLHTSNSPDLEFYKMAAKELGYAYRDPNGIQQEGIGPLDFTQNGARAVTTCSIFIEPIIRTSSRLTVEMYSTVSKILFSQNEATGVEYLRHGIKLRAIASKEIILSAGAYGSALLLLKSGIGPKKTLKKAKIPLVADLPVGMTLYNHPAFVVNVTIAFTSMDSPTLYYNLTEAGFKAYLEGKNNGLLSEEGSGPGGFFVSSIAKAAGESNWPDIEFTRGVTLINSNGQPYVPMKIVLTRPKSVGSLKMKTKRYRKGERRDTKLAIINFNYLEHKNDLQRFLEGIQKTLAIYNTNAFKSHGIKVVPYKPCSDKHNLNSEAYWTCVVRRTLTTTRHVGGTCRMGFGSKDKVAVVDKRFRVIGIKRLRIADASVIPRLTNANINAPVILIAERAATKIIRAHRA